MATVDEEFLLHLLQACAASSPLYPARFAQQEHLERNQLDAGLDELRRRGLVQFTEWIKGAGQGYALTDAGRQALSARRLPTGRAAAMAAETPATDRVDPYQRGEIVRSAILAGGRPYACWTLLAINLLFFAHGAIYTWRHDASVIDYLQGDAVVRDGNLEFSVLLELGALQPTIAVPQRGRPWWAEPQRLLLFLFLHAGILHLFMNMFVLATMGAEIEAMWGTARFVAIYFVAGIVSGCVIILINRYQQVTSNTVGASGPIYGLFTAMFVWFLLNHQHLPDDLIQAWSRAISINMFLLLASNFMPHVSWQGHLGGAIGGLLAALLLHVQRFHSSRIIRGLALAGVPLIPLIFFFAVLWQAGWF